MTQVRLCKSRSLATYVIVVAMLTWSASSVVNAIVCLVQAYSHHHHCRHLLSTPEAKRLMRAENHCSRTVTAKRKLGAKHKFILCQANATLKWPANKQLLNKKSIHNRTACRLALNTSKRMLDCCAHQRQQTLAANTLCMLLVYFFVWLTRLTPYRSEVSKIFIIFFRPIADFSETKKTVAAAYLKWLAKTRDKYRAKKLTP